MKILEFDNLLVKKYSAEAQSLALPIFLDEHRLEEEWDKVNTDLKCIVIYAAGYALYRFNTPLVLTHIFRTQSEQASIYKNDPRYKKTPFQSVHQFYRGVDARLKDFGVTKANELATHINSKFPYKKDSNLKCVLVHDVGQGEHIHFQVGA